VLPSNLLRVRFMRGQAVRPIYAQLNAGTLSLAERVIGSFEKGVRSRKGELNERLRAFEDEGFDYRLVRGLSTLLERRCVFEADSPAVNPMGARTAVFEEASRVKVVSAEERERVIQGVATSLKVQQEALEKALYSDVEEELILRKFDSIEPEPLVKHYNLSLTQTLLFKSLRMEFTATGNWKNILRAAKRLGLMYSIERNDGGYTASLDGPLSLFRMTDRYGTSMAKLLPHIVASEKWRLKADILGRSRDRIFSFELDSGEAKGLIEEIAYETLETRAQGPYDSAVEERFARSFNAYGSGWLLRREPEPLLAGRHLLIPDFSFQKQGMKVYLEIVGFWTQEYLERKINKLATITDVDMIVAVDESLACSKLQRLGGKVIYYTKNVPIRPIIEHLATRERAVVEGEAETVKIKTMRLSGDIVSISDIAREHGVSVEAVKRAVQNLEFEGYKRIGEHYVSNIKLTELATKLSGLEKLSDALTAIEPYVIDPYRVLEALGYTITWGGLDLQRSRIRKTSPRNIQ